TVSELVDDLDHAQGNPQVNDRLEAEELVVRRQFLAEGREVRQHQQERGKHDGDADHQEPGGEDPPQVFQHPAQEPVGIIDGNLDIEDVGQRLHPLGAQTFLAAVEELLAGPRRLVLRQPGGEELLGKVLQVLQGQPLRPEPLLVLLLGVVEGVLAVHELEQKMFLLLEAVVAKADGVLDDKIDATLVALRLDPQIVAQTHLDLFASFDFTGRRRVVNAALHRSGQWSVVSEERSSLTTDHWPLATDHYFCLSGSTTMVTVVPGMRRRLRLSNTAVMRTWLEAASS